MYFLYLLHLFYISTQSIFGTGEAVSDESILVYMAKGLALGVKFPICLASPGAGCRGERLSAFPPLGQLFLWGSELPLSDLRQCLKTPSLPFLAGAGRQLSLMVERFTGLSLKSNYMELT